MYAKLLETVLRNNCEKRTYNPDCLETTREVLSRLKFIGLLKRNEKVNTKHVYVQPDCFTTSLSRSLLYPESRASTLQFVHSTITRTFEILDMYEQAGDSVNNMSYTSLVGDLVQSQSGLENLKYTYQDDKKFCCDIETIRQQITTKLSRTNQVVLAGVLAPDTVPVIDEKHLDNDSVGDSEEIPIDHEKKNQSND